MTLLRTRHVKRPTACLLQLAGPRFTDAYADQLNLEHISWHGKWGSERVFGVGDVIPSMGPAAPIDVELEALVRDRVGGPSYYAYVRTKTPRSPRWGNPFPLAFGSTLRLHDGKIPTTFGAS